MYAGAIQSIGYETVGNDRRLPKTTKYAKARTFNPLVEGSIPSHPTSRASQDLPEHPRSSAFGAEPKSVPSNYGCQKLSQVLDDHPKLGCRELIAGNESPPLNLLSPILHELTGQADRCGRGHGGTRRANVARMARSRTATS